MIRKVILLLSVLVSLGTVSNAQWCITSEQLQAYKDQSPEIEAYNSQLEAHIKAELKKNKLIRAQLKTTADPTDTLHIPLVFHIIHDYGNVDYVSDNTIYDLVETINEVYMKQNSDVASVIQPFKEHVGNAKIIFHLATKDPFGKPTTGITRRASVLTVGGDDQAKMDQWAPDSYLNIWVINRIGRTPASGVVAAYATFPASAAARPYTDGIIASASQLNSNKTIPHEIGHILDLIHPWGNGQVAQYGNCDGDDEVDDTPPTHGHFAGTASSETNGLCNSVSLYDTTCTDNSAERAKIIIDSTLGLATGTDVDAGIEFDVKARMAIRSVYVYPSVANAPFTIELQQHNGSSFTNIYTSNGTTKATIDGAPQKVDLNFYNILPGTRYRLIITTNPGMGHDSVTAGVVYAKSIANVLDIKGDTKNGRYNYLYKWDIKYYYLVGNIDYPDTVNTQNIMDYANCPVMFTKLQVERMRAALSSNVGRRNNLVKDSTHVKTGILSGYGGTYGKRLDLKPVPDYSVERSIGINKPRTYFMCADGNSVFRFQNRSWRDTIDAVEFTFSNGASVPTSNQANGVIQNTFTTPGWVTVKLKATGNNSGDSTIERQDVYAADPNDKINPINGYFQEFDANGDMAKWPMFNYYKNDQKWQVNNKTGFYDNTCIMYTAYDQRTFPGIFIGSPQNDYDDMFTRAFDLSGMKTGDCNLNFMSSNAMRLISRRNDLTGNPVISDTLEISYSTDCGANWTTFKEISGVDLANKGVQEIPYAPLWQGDWKLQSIDIPSNARTETVYFRFRYHPGTTTNAFAQGVGNNFYMDRINVSSFPLGVNTLLSNENSIAVAPNPTSGEAYVVIKNNQNKTAKVIVTDITGKVVYQTQQSINNTISKIQIPAASISVKGIYLVKVVTGDKTQTQKLVVR